nr:hypothetical protein CFP56_24056 [Quercus suber]
MRQTGRAEYGDASNSPGRSVRIVQSDGPPEHLLTRFHSIPISCALIVFVFLHRRYLKKQRLEETNDPHKSLDFGMDLQTPKGKKGKDIPEMTITDLGQEGSSRPKRAHGMSMDMGLGSPYLLPGALQDSRESIHSMSRSMIDEHDPYRQVAFVRTSTESGRPPRPGDTGSIYSAANSFQSGAENARLLTNAQRMSRTGPIHDESPLSTSNAKGAEDPPLTNLPRQNHDPSRKQSLLSDPPSGPSTSAPVMNFSVPDRKSLPAPPPASSASSISEELPLPPRTTSNAAPPPRKSSANPDKLPMVPTITRESSQYGDDDDIVETTIHVPTFSIDEPHEIEREGEATRVNPGRFSIEMSNPSEQYPAAPVQRMSVMGVRPLPPDTLLTEENPEQRANRIRSFYKEYFDDSKNPDDADWDAGFADGAIFDPETGAYFVSGKPFAQPMGRRAMTPPPRGAPRISGGDHHQRHMSTMTGARGRPGPRGGPPPMPKKKLPPPKNLWRSVRIVQSDGPPEHLLTRFHSIPISCALIVFVFLHRRYLKKQRLEETNDPHKSLDFGMDLQTPKGKKGKDIPEMTITDLGQEGSSRPKRAHGMSMDMGLGSPYLLPGALQDSRESIHSMSRSMIDEHDPYRQVAFVRTSTESGRPPRPGDTGSIYSAANSFQSGAENARLLTNAQRMSRTGPIHDESPLSTSNAKGAEDPPLTNLPRQNHDPSRKQSLLSDPPSGPSTSAPVMNFSVPDRKSLPAPPPASSASSISEELPLPPRTTSNAAPPPRKSSANPDKLPMVPTITRESSQYGDDDDIVETTIHVPTFSIDEPHEIEREGEATRVNPGRFSIEMSNPSEQYPAAPVQRMSVMGVRPLPPDTLLTEENPEQRANRIRSFYKEYFDDSKNPDDADWDAGFADGAIFDPETGAYFVSGKPFAQPMGRRAMTPPPRGAPRISGGDHHQRHMSTMTGARGRPGPRGGPPPMPKKKLPPPKNLMGLPTPHKMGYDNAIASPIDFAPPTTFRDMQNGLRPDSPSRAYSPSVKAYTPLASSFEELQVMPSPHHLRKSGTFTGLDFAPPRLRAPDSASDAGSIRSARSGISAMQMDAVRAGAYRVSRIPKDVVMTKDSMASQLRPKMDLISRA